MYAYRSGVLGRAITLGDAPSPPTTMPPRVPLDEQSPPAAFVLIGTGLIVLLAVYFVVRK